MHEPFDSSLPFDIISEYMARLIGYPEDMIARAKAHPQGLLDKKGHMNVFLAKYVKTEPMRSVRIGKSKI